MRRKLVAAAVASGIALGLGFGPALAGSTQPKYGIDDLQNPQGTAGSVYTDTQRFLYDYQNEYCVEWWVILFNERPSIDKSICLGPSPD